MEFVGAGFDAEEWRKAAAAIEADLTNLTAALTEAQFHAPPRDGGWSVSYCIEHLLLAGTAFLPVWDAALEHSSDLRRPKRMDRFGWWRRWLLRLVQDPSRLKQKADDRLVPRTRRSIGEAVRQFRALHEEFARRVDRSRDVGVLAMRVRSPFRPWLRYSLGFSFDLVLAHERRHLGQAWLVRQKVTGL